MRNIVRRLLGVGLAALLSVTVAAPAVAVGGYGMKWFTGGIFHCATPPTGTFKQSRPFNPAGGFPPGTGWLPTEIRTQTCATPETNDVFGISFYFADQTSKTFLLRYPTGLGMNAGGRVPADAVAMCMVSREDRRMDCATVTWQNGIPNVYTHIPVTSPQVSYPIEVNWNTIGDNPDCTNCWG